MTVDLAEAKEGIGFLLLLSVEGTKQVFVSPARPP